MKVYILVTFLAIALYFILKPNIGAVENLDTTTVTTQDEVLAVKENRVNETSKLNAQNTTAPAVVSAEDLKEAQDNLMRTNIKVMLTKLSECTEIKNSLPSGSAEATLTTILDSVQSELGEPVVRSEDWTSTEIKLADNSKRLIRIETVYENEDIVKKLRYYKVTSTALVPIDLTQDQTTNPSESFLASLEKEGELVSREKSERVFFQNGEEISYIEKDGKIQNSEIIRVGKALKCSDYDQKSFRCQCF